MSCHPTRGSYLAANIQRRNVYTPLRSIPKESTLTLKTQLEGLQNARNGYRTRRSHRVLLVFFPCKLLKISITYC
jgi:hypothetical protein